MDFAQQQRNPAKHIGGIAFVILLHIAIGYAFMKGLHREGLKLIEEKLDVVIVEEPKIEEPPPPPEDLPPPPMDLPPPPPSQIPPPEVKVDAPPPVAAISAQQAVPVTSHTAPAPPPPTVNTPPAPPAPVTAAVACSNFGEIKEWLGDKFTQIADKEDFQGKGISSFDITLLVTLGGGGEIKEVAVRSSSNPTAARAMQSAVAAGAKRLKCAGQGRDIPVLVPLGFTLTD